MRFVKDPKVEARLHAHKIPFEFERVKMGQIDLEEGIRRQVRLISTLNEDAIFQMSGDMLKPGAAFPAPVLQKPPKGLMWAWAGNHRLNSFSLAFPGPEQELDVYTVCIRDVAMLDILPRILNEMESVIGFSKEERIFNARWLIENHSWTTADAAAEFGIRPGWIYKTNAEEEAKSYISDVSGYDTLPKHILVKLHPLSDNLNVIKGVARVLINHSVKGAEALHLIADVRKHRTELQKMGELARWEKLLEQRKSPKKRETGTDKFPRAVRDAFFRNLTGLAKTLGKGDTLTKLQITDPADVALVRRDWGLVRAAMDKLFFNGEAR